MRAGNRTPGSLSLGDWDRKTERACTNALRVRTYWSAVGLGGPATSSLKRTERERKAAQCARGAKALAKYAYAVIHREGYEAGIRRT